MRALRSIASSVHNIDPSHGGREKIVASGCFGGELLDFGGRDASAAQSATHPADDVERVAVLAGHPNGDRRVLRFDRHAFRDAPDPLAVDHSISSSRSLRSSSSSMMVGSNFGGSRSTTFKVPSLDTPIPPAMPRARLARPSMKPDA